MFVRRQKRACQWRSSLHERLSPTTLERRIGHRERETQAAHNPTSQGKPSKYMYNTNTSQIQRKYKHNIYSDS